LNALSLCVLEKNERLKNLQQCFVRGHRLQQSGQDFGHPEMRALAEAHLGQCSGEENGTILQCQKFELSGKSL
jgi:hypothetical protein